MLKVYRIFSGVLPLGYAELAPESSENPVFFYWARDKLKILSVETASKTTNKRN